MTARGRGRLLPSATFNPRSGDGQPEPKGCAMDLGRRPRAANPEVTE